MFGYHFLAQVAITGRVEGPVFIEVGGGSWERAGFGHRGCGGPVFNAPKRVLALGEPGRHG